jgi:Type II secretion system protein C
MALRLGLHTVAHPFQQKLLVSLCWLGALAISAWIASGWYWRLQSTPSQSSIAASAADPQVAAQDIASRQLFGAPAVAAATTAAPPPSLVVIGVQTRWGNLPGFAIVRDGSNPSQSWVEGDNITPGIKLIKVRADGIEVERSGSKEFIAMNAASKADGAPIMTPPPATQAPAQMAPPPPPPPPQSDKEAGNN